MSQSNTLNNFRYLFDRPSEPIFRPKGSDGTVAFSIPQSYFSDRYKPIANEVQTRFTSGQGTVIPVREFSPPNLTIPMQIDRKSYFSVFNDFHKQCADSLITTLLDIQSVEELQSALVYAQQRVNPYLFIYCLSVVMIHRPDTKNVSFPAHIYSFPELYFKGSVLSDVRARVTSVPSGYRQPIEIPRDLTATDNDVEHRLAYFREDIGLTLCHWHWHLVYPSTGPPAVMQKDRRGELFYYMHQQMMARYNIERFSNNLPRVVPISNFQDPIPEGYFPKLDSTIASRVWGARQPNARFQTVNRENDNTRVSIEDLQRWISRIYEAVQRGSVFRGTALELLRESDGIDVLGNMVESTSLSVNRQFYGNLHNQGHNVISFLHDPDARFLESAGVMWDSGISMRDPIFYRWHTLINNIFITYKETLPPYTLDQLTFGNIRITDLQVTTQTSTGGSLNNVFITHWERNKLDMSRGLDFIPRGELNVIFTHLQHESFIYNIRVENSGAQRIGTVRIFLAPKKDERGYQMRFRDQRHFFIELDRFTTTLRAGTNNIQRRSIESNTTVPFNVTFRNLDEVPLSGENAARDFIYCGCGWPDHMLIPRGTAGDGLSCDLFVMVSDYQQDRVDNTSIDSNDVRCDNAFAYCGLRNSRYPDARHMGFPFDRLPRAGVVNLTQFITQNMGVRDVKIKFEDRRTSGVTLNDQNQTRSTDQQRSSSVSSRPTNSNAGRGGTRISGR